MKKNKMYLWLLVLILSQAFTCKHTHPETKTETESTVLSNNRQLFLDLDLEDKINYHVFKLLMKGHELIEVPNKNLVTLIDYTKPSTDERLFVIDLKEKKLLYSSHVAHGKNSGENYAISFSNESGSHQSSLGFFVTENTYQGKNGYSLIMHGLEKGINEKAKERAIVIHGAPYSNPKIVESAGRLGRSYGCPALPETINETIINAIKDGTLIFIYADDDEYIKKSSIVVNDKN